jgi:hypothetical protein
MLGTPETACGRDSGAERTPVTRSPPFVALPGPSITLGVYIDAEIVSIEMVGGAVA